MPVSLGENLNIKNNKLESFGKSIYRKLNKAKAWTNITTTESGGTVSEIVGDGDIITNIECSYNNWFIDDYTASSIFFVINGKLYGNNYGSIYQIGSDTNWTSVIGSSKSYIYVLNDLGELYKIQNITNNGTYSSITKINIDAYITYISSTVSSMYCYAIGDGKLYCINNTTVTQVGSDTNWTKVIGNVSGGLIGVGLCNGYVYYLSADTATLMHTNDNFVDIVSKYVYPQEGMICALNINGELYWNDINKKLIKSDFIEGSIKQVSCNSSSNNKYISLITTDNRLFYKTSSSNWREIISDLKWDYTLSGKENKKIYAISGGKLYSIIPTNSSAITQIGTASDYKSIKGYINTSNNFTIVLAWTGDATSVDHTVYTTKSPQAGDAVYSDNELTPYSTIVSVSGTTITDEYRTYDVDIAKDSSFTSIPPATIHETVGTIELLNALNPNS